MTASVATAEQLYSLVLFEGEPSGYAYAVILDERGEELDRLFVEPPPPVEDRVQDDDIWCGTHPEADLLGWSPDMVPTYGFYNNVDDMWGCPDYQGAMSALLLEHAIRLDTDWYVENFEQRPWQ